MGNDDTQPTGVSESDDDIRHYFFPRLIPRASECGPRRFLDCTSCDLVLPLAAFVLFTPTSLSSLLVDAVRAPGDEPQHSTV